MVDTEESNFIIRVLRLAKIVFMTRFLLKCVAKQDMMSRYGILKRVFYIKIENRTLCPRNSGGSAV